MKKVLLSSVVLLFVSFAVTAQSGKTTAKPAAKATAKTPAPAGTVKFKNLL